MTILSHKTNMIQATSSPIKVLFLILSYKGTLDFVTLFTTEKPEASASGFK